MSDIRTGCPRAEVVQIITDVAEALDYAHQRNLLHRDVKPANILLAHPDSGDQRVLLADFGIARWADDISGLTATNMTVGTVSYAAPEQLMGERLDGRSDQYALAATAFHLLTGSPPFTHSNPAVVISQHLSAAPPAIGARRPELAPLDPVFAKALAKDPKDRYERCADFARALAHRLGVAPAEDDGATRLSSAAIPPDGGHKRSALRAGVIVPVVLVVLLAAAVAVAVFETRRADDERPTAAPTPTTSRAATSTPFTALPPPPEPPPSPTTTTTTTPAAAPVAVIGANCSPVGSTGTTANGSVAYCETLQSTGASLWSLTQGDIASPTVTTEATDEPLPAIEEISGAGMHAADRPNPPRVSTRHPRKQRSAAAAMKFAVVAPVAAGVTADPVYMTAFAQHLETCGFESIVVVEHTVLMTHYTSVYPYDASGRVELTADCPVPDPLDLLAYLAGQTRRLGLATGVLVLPNHHPVVLAKRVATLDSLAGGRLRLCVGMGWLKEEIEACGTEFE